MTQRTLEEKSMPTIWANMGYENVRDYDEGKKDWIDAGLPIEGEYQQRRQRRTKERKLSPYVVEEYK
jgi:3-mercaptopyruvate sulfurtransferase SseA